MQDKSFQGPLHQRSSKQTLNRSVQPFQRLLNFCLELFSLYRFDLYFQSLYENSSPYNVLSLFSVQQINVNQLFVYARSTKFKSSKSSNLTPVFIIGCLSKKGQVADLFLYKQLCVSFKENRNYCHFSDIEKEVEISTTVIKKI